MAASQRGGLGTASSERCHYVQGDLSDPRLTSGFASVLEQVARAQPGTAGKRALLSCGRRPVLRPGGRPAGPAGLLDEGEAGRRPQHWRRVVIEKPFGHDLASARALNARIRDVLDEDQIYRIDHYLGQGDGAEHHGVPLRQRHLRADVEPRLHRPRADHRGRDARRGAARRLLRTDRRAARHGAQPPVPAAVADRHGAADLASTPTPCATRRPRCWAPCSR